MKHRGLRIFGHPVHPMLAGFPVAFWVGGSVWDGVALLRPEPFWPQLAFWSLLLGTALALPAAASGFWDLTSLPPGHPAEPTAWWHMGLMSSALCLEVTSVALRWEALGVGPASVSAMTFSLAGGILCVGGGWLGGELVFRHGVAVTQSSTEDDPPEKGET